MQWWEDVVALAKQGAGPVATAMAKYIAQRTARDTLQRSFHSSGAWHRTRPGEPPAYASGKLSRGMRWTPAYTAGVLATAYVWNKEDYSRILEYGCVIMPTNKRFLHWVDSGGSWYHQFLVSPPHPFLEPTIDESVDDGSLLDVVIDEWRKYDP